MDTVNRLIEIMKPFFEAVSNNSYIRAIRAGYDSCVPVLLFASLFVLAAHLPEMAGFVWPEDLRMQIWRVYGCSMGVLSFLMAVTVTRSLTDSFNNKLPKLRQINTTMTTLVSMCCFLILSAETIEHGLATDYLGTKGVLTALVVSFIVPNIFHFFVKRAFTFKFSEEVPHFVAQYFADLVPIGVTVTIFWLFGLAVKDTTGMVFSAWLFEFVQPIFAATDTYLGISLIYGAMAAFFFVSIHGPAVIEPIVAAIFIANIDANLTTYAAGGHATHILTHSTSHFVATLGGTGATFMFGAMCAFLAKSNQLRATGKSAFVPTIFGVNEQVVFGAPIAMNPWFFAPFILAPVINVCVLKYFVEELGMNSFVYILPWTTPAALGMVLGTGLDKLSFVLVPLILIIDAAIYYPSFRAYDRKLAQNEALAAQIENEDKEEAKFTLNDGNKPKNVLAMCASGATSSMLAKTIIKGARKYNLPINATSVGYGQHRSMLKDFDLVILAPQMASMFDELKHECDMKGVKAVTTSGAEYVKITRDPDEAMNFVVNIVNE